MRHRIAGRRLGRRSEHRLALMRNLSTSLFDKEKITTTLAKAKELRSFAEKLVTLSKRETLHARRGVLKHIHDRKVVAKLFDTLSARYAQRPGGYTRIIKLGPRRGDNADMALIELVDSESATATAAEPQKKAKAGKGKAAKSTEPAAGEAAEASRKTAKKKAAPKKKAASKATKTTKKKTTKKKVVKKATSKDKA